MSMRLAPALAVLVLIAFYFVEALGAEKETVCAKYLAEYGWSKNYKVQATILNGSELNQATKSFEYSALATYVVIFWDRDEASVIEMSWPLLGVMGVQGQDQRGITWEIQKAGICF